MGEFAAVLRGGIPLDRVLFSDLESKPYSETQAHAGEERRHPIS